MINDFKPLRRPDKPTPPAGNTADTAANAEPKHESFLTPEEVVAQLNPEENTAAPSSSPVDSIAINTPAPPQPATPHKKPRFTWPPSKKTLIIAAVVLVVLGGGVTAWLLKPSHPTSNIAKTTPLVKPKKVVAPVPTTVPSVLSGLPVSPDINNGPVTGVMIENSTFARPQSGLGQASVVFEAIAEGGITRFLALFQDTAPDNVGPIRSVRPYYEQWALGFDAALAHVGGSPEALADIKTWDVRDLDEFYNGSYYHRITTREAPHNMYTAISTLNQLEASKGFTSSKFTGFPRKKETPAKKPTAAIINLTLSSATYDVQYTYNPATNSYNRDEGGAPQIDANTNTQISPKVVIAMVMPYSLEADGYHSDYGTIGNGPVYVFQDGTVTTGQWAKSSNTSQFTFTASNGTVIKLDPGQTWLTAIAKSTDVSYTP